jgi:hypothetical protein
VEFSQKGRSLALRHFAPGHFGSTALFMGLWLPLETWGIVFILAPVVLTITSSVLVPGVLLPRITSLHPEFLTDDLEDEWE